MSHIIQAYIEEKTFPKTDTTILRNLSLEIDAGETLVIVGKSGAGKSSLLNILGLIDSDFKGTYTLFDTPVASLDDKTKAAWRNQRIGFVLQESALIQSMTIEENIKLPLIYATRDDELRAKASFDEIVDSLELRSVLKKTPLECSGGERSRSVFARGILMKPELVLADEPTASLDGENKEALIELLFNLNKEYGTTIITVTHDMEFAERHQRIITIVKEG